MITSGPAPLGTMTALPCLFLAYQTIPGNSGVRKVFIALQLAMERWYARTASGAHTTTRPTTHSQV